MSKSFVLGTLYAILAASIYAINFPFSKLLLSEVDPSMMAAFLYLGAGIGMALFSFTRREEHIRAERLTKEEAPYMAGMIVLDIAAVILMMVGISWGSSANASLLGNFEIVATALFALLLFHERVSPRLWCAIVLITCACIMLSFEGVESFDFSVGSLMVLVATCCWGLENNLCRHIASKNTYEIVVLKGTFIGLGSLVIALVIGEHLPDVVLIAQAMLLGFVSYGFSVFLYIRAQRVLGASKTSAYYASAPFIGALMSFVVLQEALSTHFLLALAIMIVGATVVIWDTLQHTD